MPSTDCIRLQERVEELVSGALPPAETASLEEHVAGCADCRRTLARQRRLHAWLTDLPAAPPCAVEAPQLPAATARVLFPVRLRWAAAAAAAFVAATIALHHGARPPAASTVRVARVVDVAEAPPIADEPLLALSAGTEAVAMRRPTEVR